MKTGDKIVCILNKRGAYDNKPRLYVDKIYTMVNCYIIGYSNSKYITIEEHPGWEYPVECFITKTEYRNRKLKKLNNIVI